MPTPTRYAVWFPLERRYRKAKDGISVWCTPDLGKAMAAAGDGVVVDADDLVEHWLAYASGNYNPGVIATRYLRTPAK